MTSRGSSNSGASRPVGAGHEHHRVPILKLLTSKRILLVIATVLAWAYFVDDIQKEFPFLLAAQLRFHQFLSSLDPWKSPIKSVTPVEIDDQTFWQPPFSGTQPTSRKHLAELALAAANAGAAVIAIDFQFMSPTSTPGDDEIRKQDNQYLLQTIGEITKKGTRVVLTLGLVEDGEGGWKQQPNIFTDEAWPAGVSLGYINVPWDPRQIPLQTDASAWDGKTHKFSSLAMQTATAFQEHQNVSARVADDSKIQGALAHNEFVYGRFLKVSDFNRVRVSAHELIHGKVEPTRCCRNRIVLIGGAWHEYGPNRGKQVDTYLTPVGETPGMYMHANYVEDLLEQKFKAPVPHWIAVPLDLTLAVLLYAVFDLMAPRGWRVVLILGIVLVPLCAGYFLFAASGLYLDGIMPLAACLVDAGLEHYTELRRRAGHA